MVKWTHEMLDAELFVDCLDISINANGQLIGTKYQCPLKTEYIKSHLEWYQMEDSEIALFIKDVKEVCQERLDNGTRKEF